MILYVDLEISPTGNVIQKRGSFDPARPLLVKMQDSNRVETIEFDLNHRDSLKAMWNPGTFLERQAVLDALPKIQVFSIAGTID